MSRVSVFSSPFMLGFDELERMLDHAAKSAGDGYPPYNIERIAAAGEKGDALRITLAVAGFSRDELEITLEESQLTITGRQSGNDNRDYLHRGIAARQFKRTFILADGMEVKGADMENGLLSIDLVRPAPERRVHNIEITEAESQ
ncbi:Small heat shock protein [hydrothermal vent metagenome]|uniref:Small heat shock protein n=1 Tax=hydrothermal vent metagenome TaxID=652676 RepID=A0A3B0SIE8_9ZZZZ